METHKQMERREERKLEEGEIERKNYDVVRNTAMTIQKTLARGMIGRQRQYREV